MDSTPVEVFAGTAWEAALLKSMLEDMDIFVMLKDEIRGSTFPWQLSGGGFHSVKVIISSIDLDRAKIVVEGFERNMRRPDKE